MGGAVKVLEKGFRGITKGFKGIKVIGKILGGDILDDALGLDSLGGAVEDVFKDVSQVWAVYTGQYAADQKKLKEKQDKISARSAKYNKDVGELEGNIDRLLAFEEIFKMAASNRLDEYINKEGAELDALIEEFKRASAELQEAYDFVIALTQGSFLEKIVGSILMIVGGLASDINDILSGDADGATWKRAITGIVMLVVILLMFLIPGMQAVAASVALQVAIGLAMLNAFITLDGMYANGAATGAIMGVLDTIFNDILNLDDRIGSDFNKFDSDHADYQEMVMYTQLAIALASMSAGWASGGFSAGTELGVTEFVSTESGFVAAESTAGQAALGLTESGLASSTTSYLNGLVEMNSSNLGSSTIAGIKASTYGSIYKAYSTAQEVGDVVTANEEYEKLKIKLDMDRAQVNEAYASKISKSFMKSYKDVEYFLQDQQEHIDRYVWGMSSQSMYVDPYGTTPVANIRFTPDSATRGMSFGFEELFDESKMAGSSNYFKNILYGG